MERARSRDSGSDARTTCSRVRLYLSISTQRSEASVLGARVRRLIVPAIELPIANIVSIRPGVVHTGRVSNVTTGGTGKSGPNTKVVSRAVHHHRRFRVIEGPAVPKLNRWMSFISRRQVVTRAIK